MQRYLAIPVLIGIIFSFSVIPAQGGSTEPCYTPGNDVPPNSNPATSGGVNLHGSGGVRTATIAIGESARVDTTPKDSSGNPTKIADLVWLYNNDPTPPTAITVADGECFTPLFKGVSDGTIVVTAQYTNYDGSTYITNPAFTLTVGIGGPTTPGTSGINPDPSEDDTFCGYTFNNKIYCLMSTRGVPLSNCASEPECIANGGCTIKDRDVCGEFIRTSSTSHPLPQATASDLGKLIESIFNWSLRIVGLAVFTMAVYGGFLMVLAGGMPAMHSKGKDIITNAFLGAILLLAAYVILNTINPDFVRQNGKLPALPAPQVPR